MATLAPTAPDMDSRPGDPAVRLSGIRRVYGDVVAVAGIDLDQILCHEEERVVGEDNVVSFEGVKLQLGKQPGRRSCAGMRVLVRRHLDGTHTLWRGVELLGRYDSRGRQPEPRSKAACTETGQFTCQQHRRLRAPSSRATLAECMW